MALSTYDRSKTEGKVGLSSIVMGFLTCVYVGFAFRIGYGLERTLF